MHRTLRGNVDATADSRINRPAGTKPSSLPSAHNSSLPVSLETQIQRSHETNESSRSIQKENMILSKSQSSTNTQKDFEFLGNDFLQEELVNAVKTHFQENLNWQKNSDKTPLDNLSKHSKDESSDDDIEGIILSRKTIHIRMYVFLSSLDSIFLFKAIKLLNKYFFSFGRENYHSTSFCEPVRK